MKRSRFNEEQIVAILKDQEGGMPTAEVCRRHGISSATFYKWKSKFGGRTVVSVQSQLVSDWHSSPQPCPGSGHEVLPLSQGGRAAGLVGLSVDQVAFGIEVVVDRWITSDDELK